MMQDAQVTPEQFAKLCADLWSERAELAPLNPALDDRQLALWLLYGSLHSLLSLPADYEPEIKTAAGKDYYQSSVEALLREQFADAAAYLDALEAWLMKYDA